MHISYTAIEIDFYFARLRGRVVAISNGKWEKLIIDPSRISRMVKCAVATAQKGM